MQTVIFGRSGCPYCVRAKDLAEKLSNERDDFQYQYVDIRAEGITKEGANKQVISSQADSLIKISRIWADFFPVNTSNQPI
ncbi:glutaredoxin [Shigella sonnei]|uniref:Glutaredoxin n=3 Tax=Shigella sonnei TaxID=624 RepID=A0ABC9KLG4_SHISO|nr:GrxA family glutaredoxin [Shigella sonnei]CSR52470.1 glutaredoxin [Shigella sonnei]